MDSTGLQATGKTMVLTPARDTESLVLGEVVHRLSAPLPWGAMPALQDHRKSPGHFTARMSFWIGRH